MPSNKHMFIANDFKEVACRVPDVFVLLSSNWSLNVEPIEYINMQLFDNKMMNSEMTMHFSLTVCFHNF